MDAQTFERWVNDVGLEYKDVVKLWTDPKALSILNGFLTWVITKYHLDMEREAQEKFADPSCCGVCKEDA